MLNRACIEQELQVKNAGSGVKEAKTLPPLASSLKEF